MREIQTSLDKLLIDFKTYLSDELSTVSTKEELFDSLFVLQERYKEARKLLTYLLLTDGVKYKDRLKTLIEYNPVAFLGNLRVLLSKPLPGSKQKIEQSLVFFTKRGTSYYESLLIAIVEAKKEDHKFFLDIKRIFNSLPSVDSALLSNDIERLSKMLRNRPNKEQTGSWHKDLLAKFWEN